VYIEAGKRLTKAFGFFEWLFEIEFFDIQISNFKIEVGS